MIVLYDFSARERAMVVGTSNKTEILLGYGTLHGDTACGINPIGDLYKTQVWELAAALGVPSRLVGRLMSPLLEANLIVEVINEETGYAPARPLKQITAHDILTALRVGQGTELETLDDGTRGYVREKFESIYGAERGVAADMTREALANGAPAVPVSANPSSA